MKLILKLAGVALILLCFLPGALSIHQFYAASKFDNSVLTTGKYGSFGRRIARRAAQTRRTRGIVAGVVSFGMFVFGAGLVGVGFAIKGKDKTAQDQAAPHAQPMAAQQPAPQQGGYGPPPGGAPPGGAAPPGGPPPGGGYPPPT